MGGSTRRIRKGKEVFIRFERLESRRRTGRFEKPDENGRKTKANNSGSKEKNRQTQRGNGGVGGSHHHGPSYFEALRDYSKKQERTKKEVTFSREQVWARNISGQWEKLQSGREREKVKQVQRRKKKPIRRPEEEGERGKKNVWGKKIFIS